MQVTGHSLGGSQAVHVGRKYGVEGTAFEPGSGVAGAFRRAGPRAAPAGQGRQMPLRAPTRRSLTILHIAKLCTHTLHVDSEGECNDSSTTYYINIKKGTSLL